MIKITMPFNIQAISPGNGFCRIYATDGNNNFVVKIPKEFLVKQFFSEDGQTITTESLNGEVFVWDVKTYSEW